MNSNSTTNENSPTSVLESVPNPSTITPLPDQADIEEVLAILKAEQEDSE